MDKYKLRYQVDKLKSLFLEYSSKPTPAKVFLLNENSSSSNGTTQFVPNLVKVNWQYRDAIQLKAVSFQKNYLFTQDNKFSDIGLAEELSNEISLQAYSQNGQRSAILKSKSDAKSTKPEQFIVVYDQKKVVKTIDVKSLNDQLTIVEAANYSSFFLNDDGTILICVVEVNDKSKSKGKEESPALKDYDLNSHEYRQSWGEKLNTIFHSSIAVINLELEKLILIEKVGVSLVQPFFFKSPDDLHFSIGCVGFQELPYKLGLIYCTNRSSFLLGSKVSSDFSDVSPIEPEIYYGKADDIALASPRVYYNKANGYDCKAIFLERTAGGPHNRSARLQQFCFETRKLQTILDNKESRKLINDNTAYSDIGPLFVESLPPNCFTLDGKFVLLNSETPLTSKPFAVDLQKNELRVLNFPLDYCEIMDVKNDWIIALGSSLNRLPNVYLTNISDLTNLVWLPVEDENSKLLPNIKFDTFAFPSRDYKDKLVTCIWTSPAESADALGPTLILPHGGPHAMLPTCYYQSIALYTELGLKTCLVNYVGSLGVDEDYVTCLLGNVGTSDVNDVYDSIQYVIKNKQADKDRIILSGGSHGGFLVTSISGQHPELNFLACISRNPVIDIAGMSTSTDIPDWTFYEALGCPETRSFAQLYAGTEAEVATMHRTSPIAHIQNVKVPTLLMLGKEDLRVPYTQGVLYHRILKARGIETRCFVYDDVHGLFKINVEFDCFLNMVKFIEKFIYYNP